MPNLNDWIKAQLKRGYKDKQILASKGYPPSAVAQVDRVKYPASSTKTASSDKIHKKFPSKTIALISLFIVILFVLGSLDLLPFSLKQTSEDIATEQESVEQLDLEVIEQIRQEEAEASIGETDIEGLLKLEAREKNKEKFEEFNHDFCSNLIPENIRSTPTNEYFVNYHIDGSKGENVKWVASEQPKAEFSLFEGPQVFFVSGNEFEGCGYLEELGNSEKSSGFKNQVKSQLNYCNGKEIFINQKNEGEYDESSVYYFKSEEEMMQVTILAIQKFSNKATILSNLGCEE